MYSKILVPLDGSEIAEQVLPQVMEIAKCAGAEIILLRVPDVPTYDYLMTVPELGVAMRDQAETEAKTYLTKMAFDLRTKGFKVTARTDNGGAVYITILRTAQALSVDLIAMSTHGRTGLARLVMGSVADDVVRHTTIPVLLVRPQAVHNPLPRTESKHAAAVQ